MAPRSYVLGKRADTADATRQRILDATVEIYRDIGIPATTLKAIAARADVSRGSILHHFGSADGLLGAVLDSILDTLELPDPAVLEAMDSRDDRVRTFVGDMVDFQERTAHWWPIFEAQMQRPEVQQREARYWAHLGRLQAAALGPGLRDNPVANATLVSVIHPATVGTFLWAFEQAGLPRGDARPLLADFAVDAIRRIADRSPWEEGAS
jgi:AcrR family transcriptional regulator